MINKLVEKIKKTGAPIVVGLDPMLSYVPEHIQKKCFLMSMERHWRCRRSHLAVQQEIIDKRPMI